MIPKVSIIVPVYNAASWLHRCLDSLINQTLKEIEIVCFNDASTDNSLEILNEYALKDSRIKVINSLINVKQGGGRNRAIKASSGKYIGFVDSDDWVDETMFQKLFERAEIANSQIAICDLYSSNSDKTIVKPVSHLGSITEDMTSDEIKRRILLYGCHLWTAIFGRELFFDNDIFFPENMIYEDNAIGAPLFLSAKGISKINEHLYYYRQDNVSTTRSKNNPKFFDRLKAAEISRAHVKRLGVYDDFSEELDYSFYLLYYVNTLWGCLFNFEPPQCDKIGEIKLHCKSVLPNIKNNKYYKAQSVIKKTVITLIGNYPRILRPLLSTARQLKSHLKSAST